MKKLFIFFFIATICAHASAQIDGFQVRTSIPSWFLLSPSLGVDVTFGQRYLLTVDGSYGKWGLDSDEKGVNVNTVGGDIRRYFSDGTEGSFGNPHGGAYRGFYLGASCRYVDFDFYLSKKGYNGDFLMAGIKTGYTFRLRGNWSIDTGIGCGYVQRNYVRYSFYKPAQMDRKVADVEKNTFGLTELNVALVYRFNL